ncbi:MAG TPA: ferrochelatase [Burkholderiaceae bacterium]|nr:ferrochelatase [Burkholderiaceae bacterium]
MKFLSAAAHGNSLADRTALLLINLGTPRAPTRAAVREYLDEFLLDSRVVEIPRLAWWMLLKAVVLPTRSAASAARYASVWTDEGSPLLAHSERQHRALIAELQRRKLDLQVYLAMRYGEPSVDSALERMRQEQVNRLLVLPMYPQYSATTTGSAFDAVIRVLQRTRNVPELRWIRSFPDDPGYIEALRRSVRGYWDDHGRPDKLVMSFHGLPRRNLQLGDPYQKECSHTARLLAQALGIQEHEYALCFQSRFGRARWLEPYTVDTLRALARSGTGRVDVICPGFVADCLETLEEIALEARREFLTSGGREFHYIACLNEAPRFIVALADLAERHVQGWPVAVRERADREQQAQAGVARAPELGAAG